MLMKTKKEIVIAERNHFADKAEWVEYGRKLAWTEIGVGWLIGAWWNAGEAYGDRVELARECGFKPKHCRNCGWVVENVSCRHDTLSFWHHAYVAALPAAQQKKWLARAVKEGWSANKLKAEIARQAAIGRTRKMEFDAKSIGKYTVLYADPPWQYEHPPIGDSNRSIENHYPTMEVERICKLDVESIAHENSVLFMWATSPKLIECMQVIEAWGFLYRTSMVWVKDKFGTGYYVREQHESLLIAKRGELPPPDPALRPSSIISAPRLEHSAKPPEVRAIIDGMYPGIRKIELFGRNVEERPMWSAWGNQA